MEKKYNAKIIFKVNKFFGKDENSYYIKKKCVQLRNKNRTYKSKNRIYRYKNVYWISSNNNFLIVILYLVFHNLLKEYSQTIINISSSIITIKINQTGMQNIFSGEKTCWAAKFDPPDKVIINNIEENDVSSQYDLKKTKNIN